MVYAYNWTQAWKVSTQQSMKAASKMSNILFNAQISVSIFSIARFLWMFLFFSFDGQYTICLAFEAKKRIHDRDEKWDGTKERGRSFARNTKWDCIFSFGLCCNVPFQCVDVTFRSFNFNCKPNYVLLVSDGNEC